MQFRTAQGAWVKGSGGALAASVRDGQQARRKFAAGRGKSGAYSRNSDLAIRRAEQGERIERAKMKRVERELGFVNEADIWGRALTIRMPRRIVRTFRKVTRSTTGKPSRALPTYRRPLIDRRGRMSLFMRVRYFGFKSPKWTDGCASEHVLYTLREDALHVGRNSPGWMSNIGEHAAEVADGWKVLEEVEKGHRSNAIVQYRLVIGLPHELDADQQAKLVRNFCERTFGRLGLPFVAAVHRPDEGGDQRNFHAHICFSTRPMERTGSFEWRVTQEKVNGLTDPDGLALMRAQLAAVLNHACRKAGLQKRYTHQDYEKRGIDARRTEHLGPERTAVYRAGEQVIKVDENALIIDRNDAAEEVRKAKARVKLATRHDAWLDTLAEIARHRHRLTSLLTSVAALRRSAYGLRAAPRQSDGLNPSFQELGRKAKIVATRAKAAREAVIDGASSTLHLDPLRHMQVADRNLIDAISAARRTRSDAQRIASQRAELERLRLWVAEEAESLAAEKKKAPAGAAVRGDASAVPKHAASSDLGEHACESDTASTRGHRKISAAAPRDLQGQRDPAGKAFSRDGLDDLEMLARIERKRARLVERDGKVQPRDPGTLTTDEREWLAKRPRTAALILRRQEEEIRDLGLWLEAHAQPLARQFLRLTPRCRSEIEAYRTEPFIIAALGRIDREMLAATASRSDAEGIDAPVKRTRVSPEVEKALKSTPQPPSFEDLATTHVKHLHWAFLLAKTDEERRRAAVQIRRNKDALMAMNAHAHPLWTAEQARARNQQREVQNGPFVGR